jgi:hypothetical protein
MTCDDLKICHAMAHSRSNQLVVPLPTPVSLALKFHHLPMIWFVIGGPGEAGTILAMRALCEQAAVNSSRSLYIRRYRCSVGVRGPLISRLYARTANLVGLLLRFKGGKKLDDFSGASVIWLQTRDHGGRQPRTISPAPADRDAAPAIGGFGGVTVCVEAPERTVELLTETFGYRQVAEDASRRRLRAANANTSARAGKGSQARHHQ